MSRIFDTHAHYEDSRFDFDRDALLKGLPLRGVEGVITCGIDIKTSEKALALASVYQSCLRHRPAGGGQGFARGFCPAVGAAEK